MSIAVADLKFFLSERMTDNSDGGGKMTATEIVSGAENQIFDDVTDVDRAAGDVSIRKVFGSVPATTPINIWTPVSLFSSHPTTPPHRCWRSRPVIFTTNDLR